MNFNIIKFFNENGNVWKSFRFEVLHTHQGNCRIYIEGNRKTKYFARGQGYDKETAVITDMINDLLGESIIFNNPIKEFNKLKNCYIEKLFEGKNSNVYYISFIKEENE